MAFTWLARRLGYAGLRFVPAPRARFGNVREPILNRGWVRLVSTANNGNGRGAGEGIGGGGGGGGGSDSKSFGVEKASERTVSPKLTEEKRKRALAAAAAAKESERLWDTFVPDRNWGLTSPMFWVLLVLVVTLHMYNRRKDREREAVESEASIRDRALREEAEAKRKERQDEMKSEYEE
eukprot:GHVU01198017.1.p2 GENE.GHVU01198017.1~~GHVU01198017.1.p2  ORF type:complete len:180 (+),score=39.80 GHVU01198017.1:353-892(+)